MGGDLIAPTSASASNNNSGDTFDLLGGISSLSAPAPTPTPQLQPQSQPIDLQYSAPPTNAPTSGSPLSFQAQPYASNMNWSLPPTQQIQPPYISPPSTSMPHPPQIQPANTSITLSMPKPSEPAPTSTVRFSLYQSNNTNSLIDFSNFREELDQLPK